MIGATTVRTGAKAVANEFFSLVMLDIKEDIAELVLLEYCARFSNPVFTPSLTALIARNTPENTLKEQSLVVEDFGVEL